MSTERIKSILKKLHEDLASKQKVDPELKKLLQNLDKDIHELLAKGVQGRAEATDLKSRAGALAVDFEARHPQAEKIIRELIDTLEKMGI